MTFPHMRLCPSLLGNQMLGSCVAYLLLSFWGLRAQLGLHKHALVRLDWLTGCSHVRSGAVLI